MDRPNLENLRRALSSRKSRRGRLPRALREAALAHARRRRRAGAADAAIAAELGLSYATVRRWMSPARLVPVEVVDAEMVATERAPRTVSVVSPSGYRVDGVTLEEAATLLRVLG